MWMGCRWERKEKWMVERNPVIRKEGTDEADAEQEDLALCGSLRGRNKQERAQIPLLISWI